MNIPEHLLAGALDDDDPVAAQRPAPASGSTATPWKRTWPPALGAAPHNAFT
ncbi:hypothetical protein [Streptomyces sp. Je 1-369]|uniref:hypothetical protein n=1 Tax=Streptomyces sp. Je 1-369 TaxID=2966192 RepID=UPI0022861C94|nr:hypothetical protein [Streptomyces sp. Je 1-369]WAL97937.1 hypothetical protein NOO62_27680 [Streptomyces sp. Je 1-369]